MRLYPAVFAAGISMVAVPAWAVPTLVDPTLSISTYATGLSSPTDFRFISANSMLAIEKTTGQVKLVQNGAVGSPVLDLNVSSDSERGLLSIALAPNFPTDPSVYLYYSRSTIAGDSTVTGEWAGNRLSKFTWNGSALSGEVPMMDILPDPSGNGPNHDGGPILFGPDGKLYGVLGELNRNLAEENNLGAANTSSHVGGIYRLNADGSLPADNPFIGNANTDFRKWFAYGVRNSFGMAFDPVTNKLWDSENGPNSYDEINVVASGFNSGWNKIMGPDSLDPQNVSDLVQLPGSAYSDPEFSWLSTIAPTSIRFLAGSALDGAYHDGVLVGDVNTNKLYLLRLNSNRDGFVFNDISLNDLVADSATERDLLTFGSNTGGTTSIQMGPDGLLYLLSLGDGNIYRIVPGEWAINGNGTWGNTNSWTNHIVPTGAGSGHAWFLGGLTSTNGVVDLNGDRSVAGITFDNALHSYTIARVTTGTLTLGDGNVTATIDVTSGTHTISAPVNLNSNTIITVAASSALNMSGVVVVAAAKDITKAGPGTASIGGLEGTAGNIDQNAGLLNLSVDSGKSLVARRLRLNNLTLTATAALTLNERLVGTSSDTASKVETLAMDPTATMNLKNNSMVIDTGTLATIRPLVAVPGGGRIFTDSTVGAGGKAVAIGYAAGNDPNITGLGGSLAGQSFGPGSVLLKYTFVGDGNLDGSVDGSDVALWAQNFSGALGPNPANPRNWTQGDWNYDGSVDGSDAALWAQNFTGALGGGGLGAVIVGQEAAQAVPEPGGLILLAGGGVLGLRRRSRRYR